MLVALVMVVVVAFFLACKEFGGRFDHSFPACAFFFLSGDHLANANSIFLGQYQSTAAQRAETTVAVQWLMATFSSLLQGPWGKVIYCPACTFFSFYIS